MSSKRKINQAVMIVDDSGWPRIMSKAAARAAFSSDYYSLFIHEYNNFRDAAQFIELRASSLSGSTLYVFDVNLSDDPSENGIVLANRVNDVNGLARIIIMTSDHRITADTLDGVADFVVYKDQEKNDFLKNLSDGINLLYPTRKITSGYRDSF
jgi:hypothetical protein